MPVMNMVTGGGSPPKVIDGSVKPDTFPTVSAPPEPYAGWAHLTIEKPDNLEAENIKEGVAIAGVTGTYDPKPNLETVTITPPIFPTTVVADEGYDGLKQVNVEKPENLEPENVKAGVTIAGTTGTYEGQGTEEKFKQLVTGRIAAVDESDLAGITSLRSYAFHNCQNLVKISIPGTVTSVGDYCFYQNSIENLIFPDSVESIGYSCCYGIKSRSIVLPEKIKVLESALFAYAKISSGELKIPSSVTTIDGTYVFYFSGESARVNVILQSATPPKLTSPYSTFGNAIITVPKGSLETYKTATNWSKYADIMVEAKE